MCLVESGTRICQSVTPCLALPQPQLSNCQRNRHLPSYPPNCLLCIPLLTHQHHVTLDMAIKRHLCQKVFARSKKRNYLCQNIVYFFPDVGGWSEDIGLEKYEG